MTDRTAHEAGPFCRGCAAEYAEATERYGHPVPYAYAHGHAVGLAHGDAVRAAAHPPATVPDEGLRAAAQGVIDTLGWWEDSYGRQRVSYPVDRDGDSDPDVDGAFYALLAALSATKAQEP